MDAQPLHIINIEDIYEQYIGLSSSQVKKLWKKNYAPLLGRLSFIAGSAFMSPHVCTCSTMQNATVCNYL